MKHLQRTVIAIVAALGVLFVGVAVAQDVSEPEPPPPETCEECEATGGAWFFDECFDPEACGCGWSRKICWRQPNRLRRLLLRSPCLQRRLSCSTPADNTTSTQRPSDLAGVAPRRPVPVMLGQGPGRRGCTAVHGLPPKRLGLRCWHQADRGSCCPAHVNCVVSAMGRMAVARLRSGVHPLGCRFGEEMSMSAKAGRVRVVALAIAVLVVAACGGGADETDTASSDTTGGKDEFDVVLAAVGEPTDRYEDPSLWVCRGSPTDEICTSDLATTVVGADGTAEVVDRPAAVQPDADCFYVYPTVDLRQEPGNATLDDISDMELMVRQQAAQFSSLCRVFAPLYEQATIGTYDLLEPEPADLAAPQFKHAYAQVLDAFRWYMANENDGRPIVLLGHSQGSHHLARLASELFETTPQLADQLVMAALTGAGGFGVNVTKGEAVGGTFNTLPLCSTLEDTGCVVAFNSYNVTSPPQSPGFASAGPEGTETACVNPAELVNGDPVVGESVFDYPEMGFDSLSTDISDLGLGEVTTQYLTYPLAYTAACISAGTETWLQITPADPTDPRPQIPIDNPPMTAIGLGLHLLDYQLLAGDLLALTEAKIDTAKTE